MAEAGVDAAPDAGADDAGDAGAAREGACEDQAVAFCTRILTCSPITLAQRYPSLVACEAIQKQVCMLAFAAPSSGQTVAGLEACAVADATWACDDFLSLQNPPPACQTVTGALPNGAACAVQQQCQSGYCNVAVGSLCGTCASPPAPGTPCAHIFCARGDSCGGTPPTCQQPSNLGSPCGLGATCIDGLSCIGATATAMGLCEAAQENLGDPCDAGPCDYYAGLACNFTTLTCEQLRVSPPGGPCGVVDDQSTTACAVSICERGVCVPYPTGGEACEVGGIACLSPWYCIAEDGGAAGTCQLHGSVTCN